MIQDPDVPNMLTALAWLGRQGTRAITARGFIALALPPLDRLLKPVSLGLRAVRARRRFGHVGVVIRHFAGLSVTKT